MRRAGGRAECAHGGGAQRDALVARERARDLRGGGGSALPRDRGRDMRRGRGEEALDFDVCAAHVVGKRDLGASDRRALAAHKVV